MAARDFTYSIVGTHFAGESKGGRVPDGSPTGRPRTCSWSEVVDFIAAPRQADDKSDVPLFAPYTLVAQPVRSDRGALLRNRNIETVQFLALDIEGGGTEKNPNKVLTDADIDGICDHLSKLPFETVFFNSHSDGQYGKGRRGRILVPLSRPIILADFGVDTQTQGKWWSGKAYWALVKIVLGSWAEQDNIVVGLGGTKGLKHLYYMRSSPPDKPGWLFRYQQDVWLDPYPVLESLPETVASEPELTSGLTITKKRLKQACEKWGRAASVEARHAAQALERVLDGQTCSEKDSGTGFETCNNLCRFLLKEFYPFDVDAVVNDIFTYSCHAWSQISGQSLEQELEYVREKFDYWLKIRKEESKSWRSELIYSKEGSIRDCRPNIILILANHTDWEGVFGFDERTQQPVLLRAPPVDGMRDRRTKYPSPIADIDWQDVMCWLSKQEKLVTTPIPVGESIELVAAQRRYDPMREYFDGLVWDKVPRLSTWLTDCAGVADTNFVREVGKCWLLSGVARVFLPGCKAEGMLILEGEQGVGKSTLFRELCPIPELFTDQLPPVGEKDSYMQIQGKFLIEVSELSAVHKASNTANKQFLSNCTDTFRPPFKRSVINVPRRCIFAGTTNNHEYLTDVTGGRRYWPVAVQRAINIPRLKSIRDQLWAEAVALFHKGVQWHLDAAVELLARREQERRRMVDPWEDQILAGMVLDRAKDVPQQLSGDSFSGLKPQQIDVYRYAKHGVDYYLVLRNDVFAYVGHGKASDQSLAVAKRIAEVMHAIGWVTGPRLRPGGVTRVKTFQRRVKIVSKHGADAVDHDDRDD